MKRPNAPTIWIVSFFAALAGFAVGDYSMTSDDHVPRFMNGVSYAESTHTLVRQAFDETQALRNYVRQLPWPEAGWIFRDWGTHEGWEKEESADKTQIRFWYSFEIPVDSAFVKCPACGHTKQRYEMRGNR